MHVPGQRGGAAITADLSCRERVGLVTGPKPAMIFRDRNADQARAVQVPVILDWECRIAIESCGPAGEHGLTEFARPCDDCSLFIAEAEGMWIEDRRVNLADCSYILAHLDCHLGRHLY